MKAQATQALQVLQRNTASDLDILFPASRSQHLPSEAVYDLSLTIALNSTQLGESLGHLDEQPDAFALPSTALHCSFLAVLRRALGTRVKAIHLTLLSTSSVAHLGLIYQSGEATRLVDHGPPASDEAGCRVFQQFWGDKSELRRFKDGKIEEVVVWEAPTVLSRFAVPEQIVRYILQHKFNVQSDQLKSHVSDLHQIVQEPVTWRQRLYQADPEVNGFSGIMKSFEELSTALRDLSDLPLHIKSIAPASDSLRYSSTFIPGGRKTKQYHHLPEQTSFVTAADVVITFEQSGKWPSDLQAIQKVKTAFLVQIGNLLQKVIPHAQCATAFNPQSSASSDNLALEVLMPSGFAFRLHIFHEPEIALLGEASFDDSSLTSALQCYRQRLVLRPRHHAAFVSLIHQYPALSGTTRLVKRWINSHLLTSHFSTEQIELLCAHVFLRGNPPASPVRGFVCVLHLISIWCWWSEPLLTPIFTASKREGSALDAASLGRGIDFPGDKAAAVQASFNAARQNDPAINAGAWFLATEEDPASRWWNWSKPNRMLAGRIKDLASASLASFGETLTPKVRF